MKKHIKFLIKIIKKNQKVKKQKLKKLIDKIKKKYFNGR